MLPTLSRLSVSCEPESRLRYRCSSRYLRISPLHREFHFPLSHSRTAVSRAGPELSSGFAPLTYHSAYAPFTPNNSGQRLPPPYYRGCWHGVSRGFFERYRQPLKLFTSEEFFPPERGLHSLELHPSRGVAGSAFRPLPNIPHCCLP